MAQRNDGSRRRFLQRTVSISAAGICGASVLRHDRLRASGILGANDRIGIGYIAAGRRARQLMGLPRGAEIVAVADVDLDRASKVAAERRCRAYHDYRALLDDPRVDAVIVATPDPWHVLASIDACQAGKDVYCEKPLSLTIREGRELVRAARKYERVVQTGSHQRSLEANRKACAFVRQGGLGKIKEVIGHNYPSPWEGRFAGQTVPEGLDWNRWCGPAPLLPYHRDIFLPRAKPGWVSFRAYSGGEMTGWGAHGFDQIQWALGADDGGPVEVWTEGRSFEAPFYRRPEGRARGDDACRRPAVFFRYSSGAIVRLGDAPPGGAIFIGERGRMVIDRGRYRIEPAEIAGDLRADGRTSDTGPGRHLEDWIDCIRSRRRPVADVEIGHRSAIVCHLGNIARWTGRRLAWDPRREMFEHDEAANALTDRPRRKGFELPKLA